jgi:hypothetical protein
VVKQHLLAEIDALKARCAALESLARASSHGSIIFEPSRNHNLPGSLVLGDDSNNPYQGVDANDLQGVDNGAAVSSTDLDFQLGVSLSSYGMNTGSPHVTSSMGQPTTDLDWDQWVDFNPSTFPADQNHDAGRLNPAVGGSYEVSTVDSSASASGGPGSPMVAATSRPRHHCTDCMESFSRLADLRRHARTHNPNATRFPCTQPGCGREFRRMDKLSDHRRRKNH